MKLFPTGLLILFAGTGPLVADNLTSVANQTMPLMQEGATARAVAMGYTYVGVAEGSAALFWNPAGLSGLKVPETALHHNFGLGNSIQEIGVFGCPAGEWGGFAGSLSYVFNGFFLGYDAQGNKTGLYSAGDVGGSLGWGKQWMPGLSLGAAVKFNQQNLASQSYSIFAADLGLLWNPVSTLQFGAAYTNLGEQVADSFLASGFRMGASYTFDVGKDDQFLLAVSSELQTGGISRLNVGGEDTLFHFLALSAGYQANLTDPGLAGLTGLTAGAGIRAEHFLLDYAFVPYGGLGSTHRLSLTYQFPR